MRAKGIKNTDPGREVDSFFRVAWFLVTKSEPQKKHQKVGEQPHPLIDREVLLHKWELFYF